MALADLLIKFNAARPAVDARGAFTKEVADALTKLIKIFNDNVTETGAMLAGFVEQGPATTSGLTMATNRLLGRTTASTGAIEEISVGAGLTLLAGVLDAPASTGSAAWTEYEIDFGSTPAYDATFTVVDATVSAITEVAVVQSGATATGRADGDALFDSVTYAAVPAAGQFTLYALASPGPVVGKRKILYQVGT